MPAASRLRVPVPEGAHCDMIPDWSDRHRVLVVHEDDDVRQAYVSMLTMAGYKVASAWSAESAMRHLGRGMHPCVVVFDLPRAASVNLLNALERDAWNRPAAVAILSGSSDQRVVTHRQRCVVLPKPIEGAALVAAVAAYCDRHFAVG